MSKLILTLKIDAVEEFDVIKVTIGDKVYEKKISFTYGIFEQVGFWHVVWEKTGDQLQEYMKKAGAK